MGVAAASPGRRRFRLVILGLAVLLSLAAVEVVLRYRAWKLNYESLEGAFARQPEQSPSGRTRFFDLIQPSPDDKLIYELRPNLKTEYSGHPMTTNCLGFRTPEFPREKQPGMITIVGLGGSIMFGHGVGDGEDFFALMAEQLRTSHPERVWRCINTAVPSYNVVMKVETLKEKGLQFEPDLVVLEIASNNLDLPNYVRVDEDPFDLGQSFILDFLRERRESDDETCKRYSVLAAVDRPELSWDGEVATDPSRVPERYRDLVGWGPYYKALDELKRLSRQRGFEVVVVTNLEYNLVGEMLAECRKRGFRTVLTMDEIEAWFEEQLHEPFSIERYKQSELVVSEENLHPSVLQHEMIARRLTNELETSRVIERLLKKVPPAGAR